MTLALLTLVLQACIPGNLAEHKPVANSRTSGWPGVITDGRLAQESSVWDGPQSALMENSSSWFIVDLGAEYDLEAMALQADNDDRYIVDGSPDRRTWRPIWIANATNDPGLRTRWGPLRQQSSARYLRVRAEDGDGRYAVSELRAYCETPKEWPPKLVAPPRFAWSFEFKIAIARFVIAIFGSLVLLLGLYRRGRLFDAGLIVAGLLSYACFYSWGRFHDGRFVHIWDSYHYYIGGKYFDELGFTRLYDCTAVAEAEDGQMYRVLHRKQRNLENNDLESTTEIVGHPDRCKDHFDADRWRQFKNDVRYFRSELNARDWESVQSDHGFNGTPFWSAWAGLFARALPASLWHVRMLAMLDVLCIAAMWGCVWWAFGWRTMVVAMLFWGTNFPARYYWNGGAFLRMDWLLTLIASLCLMKKNRPGWAGVLLAISTLLRIFPGFVLGALVLRWLWRGLRLKDWRVPAASRRFVLAFALTIAAGVGWSTATFGTQAWPAFVRNSQKHLATPLTNNMGLKSIVGWSPGTRAKVLKNTRMVDPFHTWKEARRNMYRARLPIFLLLLAGFCVLFARVVAEEDETTTLILGVALVVCAAELTSYYYSFMLAFGLLWPRHPRVGLLLALASMGSTWLTWAISWEDDLYIAISVIFILFILLTLREVWEQRRATPQPEPQPLPAAKKRGRRGPASKRR